MPTSPSLRANGSRQCASDDSFREAIQIDASLLDCFVAAHRNHGKRAHILSSRRQIAFVMAA
jgi:hypothetical protein